MTFSQALEAVKQGHAIQRSGWNGSGLIVKAQFPDEHSKMTQPYLYIEYPEDHKVTPGARCPWLASQTDIMADDWSVLIAGVHMTDGTYIHQVLVGDEEKQGFLPRRVCADHFTAEEWVLYSFVSQIERLGASVELTNCIVALSKAREHLANHVDAQLSKVNS